jgi:hypothetical protein
MFEPVFAPLLSAPFPAAPRFYRSRAAAPRNEDHFSAALAPPPPPLLLNGGKPVGPTEGLPVNPAGRMLGLVGQAFRPDCSAASAWKG